ncbi:protein toll-like [Uranotaenia lowii]|uniref:protein toll-like n=1 Tax=Uranotaenia lowii TaxID=190385 RepID=UPI00247A991F|nr:protein toll-like [Uranotaenia lowii]XP_055588253.1 protein toll-like [Uranotaenia lowii]XP_055588254.1 protein toll-like [Uranotaenia lowii]
MDSIIRMVAFLFPFLAALLTHNLANSFPQNYDYVIGADYGAVTGLSGSPGAGRRSSGSGQDQRFVCPEPTPSSDYSCMYVGGYYEIQSPVINPQLTIKIDPGKYAQIECYDKHEFDDLPHLNLGNTSQIKITRCKLSQHKSILQHISFLGVKNIKDFWYQSLGKDFGVKLVHQHFDGMRNLEKLILTSGIEDLQPDLFSDLPNLKWLNLRSNYVKLLHNVFDNLTNLVILELAINQINELEPGLFKNQRNLRHLNLFRNQLNNITKESFRGAETIQELDLSANAIESFDPDVFSLLPDLTELNLSFNRFTTLPENLLAENRKLKDFRLVHNQAPMQTLPESFLANLPQLKTVILNRCSFTHLPATLLKGSSEIAMLDFSYNQLTSLPEQLLRDQLQLTDLNLAYNELEILPDRLLDNTVKLEKLRLSYNRLYNLTANVFYALENLQELYLDNNYLHSIDRNAFDRTSTLVKLYLQNNFLSFHDFSFVEQELDIAEGDGTPFQTLNNLRILNLRNNSITTIFRDWAVNAIKLEELDLSYNNISMLSYSSLPFISSRIRVNLTHNKISQIELRDMEQIIMGQPDSYVSHVDLYLNDNPLNCDCVLLQFIQYLRQMMGKRVYKTITFNADNLRCAEPKQFEGRLVSSLELEDLFCDLDQPGTEVKLCPAKCHCTTRPFDKALIVNCTKQGLTEIPPLPVPSNFAHEYTELHMEYNNVSELPTEELTGYFSVGKLFMQNNSLVQLLPENLPSKLRMLDVSNNRLVVLNQSVIEVLNSSKFLENTRMAGNRWQCDCTTSELVNFVQRNQQRIGDINQLTCEGGTSFTSVTISDLCNRDLTVILGWSISLTILFILIAILTIFYYRYNMEIKVWLFKNGLFLWLVTEEELDKDKLYDAFISYSHKDEDFITEQLVPTLEKEPMNFKTCLHIRDWTAGEMISTQIIKSVEESRRTIVVLSSNFLESEWGKMEFRTAHINSMKEKRVRVIVIIYDEIGDIESLEPELKAYLKMNTYVKWGDPWFWDKLRYAMPHPPTVKGIKGKGLIKNHIKSSVDDKLELIKPVPVTPPPQTTPPAEMNGHARSPFTITNGKTMNGNGYHVNGHLVNGFTNGHVNGAFMINSNAKQSDV